MDVDYFCRSYPDCQAPGNAISGREGGGGVLACDSNGFGVT